MGTKIKCVYKITNKINGKMYVGQTTNLHRRWIWHRNKCNKGRVDYKKSISSPLYSDFEKYGKDNFSVEILEIVEGKEERLAREIYWIEKLNTIEPNGYNKSRGGNLNKPSKISDEELKGIVKMLEDGKSAKEIQSKYGISLQFITDINVGRYRKNPNLNYPIRKHPSSFYERGDEYKKCSICKRPIGKSHGICKECSMELREKAKYGISGKELEKQIRKCIDSGMSIEEIGRKFNVTGNAIKRKMKKYRLVG